MPRPRYKTLVLFLALCCFGNTPARIPPWPSTMSREFTKKGKKKTGLQGRAFPTLTVKIMWYTRPILTLLGLSELLFLQK